jgi:integrase/recombinase XerD
MGGKGRTVPIGPHAGRALDRYIRAWRSHRLADTEALCLGDRGKEFSYFGLHAALKNRARQAGISGFQPHLLRHTAAHRWLAAGGSEGGLMAVAGWTRPDLQRRTTPGLGRTPTTEIDQDVGTVWPIATSSTVSASGSGTSASPR